MKLIDRLYHLVGLKANNAQNHITGYVRKKSPNENVINRIIETSNYRVRKDVGDWRKALNMAENKENPRRWMYYNLCDELVLDAHLSSQMQTRKLKLMGLNFKLSDHSSKKIDDDKTAMLKKQWFYDIIAMALDATYYGHSLIQLTQVSDAGVVVDLVPRRHVRPEYGDYLVRQQDSRGVPYRGTPLMDYLIEVGDSSTLGLLAKAAPNVLWKKNALMCWSEYCEIFGMPIRVGTTNTRNDSDLDRLETQLRDMGTAAYALLQSGEDVKFIESTKGDAYNVYNQLVERANSELSKLVLGQTLTADTGKSGTRAQGEVHERVADSILAADMLLIESLVNDKLLPLLIKHGMPLQGLVFEYVVKQEITALDWTIDSGLLQHFDIPEAYFAEKYSVPVKKKAAAPKDAKQADDDADTEQNRSDYATVMQLHQEIQQLYSHHCDHE